jgi:hypothetical protein
VSGAGSSGLFGGVYAQRRVLVTGHTGFKGSWLVLWLSQLGAEVVGVALDPPTQPSHFEACGAASGITIVALMPRRVAWYATPCAWLPADAQITPRARSAASRVMSLLQAPRSLNEPVCCMYSRFVKTVQPHNAESVLDSRQVVLMTAPS